MPFVDEIWTISNQDLEKLVFVPYAELFLTSDPTLDGFHQEHARTYLRLLFTSVSSVNERPKMPLAHP